MLHDLLIAVHALSGVVSFVVGCLLVFAPGYRTDRRLFDLYLWPLVGLVVFLLLVIVVDWPQLSDTERIIFSGLVLLGLYMLYRANQAREALNQRPAGWQSRYIDHIGFTLTSLFEGFIIISGIDLGMEGWLVAVAAVLGLIVGRWAIERAKSSVQPVAG